MSSTATPADPLAQLSFELERFRWEGEERLEVSGRWFAVRGRRFVRPTLTLRGGGRRRPPAPPVGGGRPPPPDDRGARPQAVGGHRRGALDGSVRLARAPG